MAERDEIAEEAYRLLAELHLLAAELAALMVEVTEGARAPKIDSGAAGQELEP